MKTSPKFTSRRDCFLGSCIRVAEKRTSRRVIIPTQVYFDLDWDLVNRIDEIRTEYGSLDLEPQQLTDLRYYSLINSHLVDNCAAIERDSLSLVFSSNYSINSQRKTTVVRSTINFSGQISQEIQQDLWQSNPRLSALVIEAHHWLVGEILRQLPLTSNSHTRLISWILWLPIAIAFSAVIWLSLPLSVLFKIVIIILFLYFLKRSSDRVIARQLKRWIVRQLISGWLSNQTKKRQLGFKILSLLI